MRDRRMPYAERVSEHPDYAITEASIPKCDLKTLLVA